jgi:DNA-binding PadR family transcriptional regulator
MTRGSLGDFEKLVMLAILQLGEEAYGATILRELERRTGRSVSAGAAYVALRRLEQKAMVSSFFGEAIPERGGRPKRYFRMQPDGIRALQQARAAWDAMAEGLDHLLEPRG